MPKINYELNANVVTYYDRDTGTPTTISDWIRLIKLNKYQINGRPLADFDWTVGDKHIDIRSEDFPNVPPKEYQAEVEAKIKHLFLTELLNMAVLDAQKKKQVVEYLMKHLHQGGFLRFFALSFGSMVSAETEFKMSAGDMQDISMNFVATNDGFYIEESGKFKKVTIPNGRNGAKPIESQQGLINVNHSRVEVDFVHPDPSYEKFQPTITHQECSIECTNKKVNKSLVEYGVIKKIPKWQKFHSDKSPVQISVDPKPAMSRDAFVHAWQKSVKDNQILVNGVTVNAHDHNSFSTYEYIMEFFDQVLLERYPRDDLGKRSQALEQLKVHFMREGALCPVATGVEALLQDSYKICDKALTPEQEALYNAYEISKPSDIGMKRSINLVSTVSGLNMQEKVQVTHLKVEGRDELIEPDKGKNHVLKCQATIALDLTKTQSKIDISMNTVSYGAEEVSKCLDKRGFFERMKDIIGRIFGFHNISSISLKEDPELLAVPDNDLPTPPLS